jgi:DNA polymerase-3 subunit epsilon
MGLWREGEGVPGGGRAPGSAPAASAELVNITGPVWAHGLPPYVIFVDVETTGLRSTDKIVSLAAARLHTAGFAAGKLDVEMLHLIFAPGRKSHPKAEEVHGYSDWVLRHQEPFAEHAEGIWKFIHRAPVITAHNAAFDLPFIDRELRAAGCPPVSRPSYCTMESYRDRETGGKASLDAICAKIGRRRSGKRHGALEDALLCMQVYLWLHDCPLRFNFPPDMEMKPFNLRDVPPVPEGPLPRRKRAPKV